MTLNSVILIYSGLIFAVCMFLFIKLTLSALIFRRKVAYVHGFSEGILTGAFYTMLIIMLCLILLQFTSFFIFIANNEFLNILRLVFITISAVFFFFFKAKTPPLLAYWFDKTSFFESSKNSGQIPYSDIYAARISKKINLSTMNNQQLCKITFYVKGKLLLGIPKKYVCRLAAYEITALATQVKFNQSDPVSDTLSVRYILPRIMLCCFSFLLILSLALPLFSTGILNPHFLSKSDIPLTAPVQTVVTPTATSIQDDKIFVLYDNIGVLNVYNSDTNFLYAVSFETLPFKKTTFGLTDKLVCINNGQMTFLYDINTGNISGSSFELTSYENSFEPDHISSLPGHAQMYKLFDISFSWIIISSLTVITFVMKYITSNRPLYSAKQKNYPES